MSDITDVTSQGIDTIDISADNIEDTTPEASDSKENDTSDKDSNTEIQSTMEDTQEHTNESGESDEAASASLSQGSYRELAADSILTTKELGDTVMENCFYYEEITDDIKSRIVGKSYGEGCIVSFDLLRYIRVLYYGFDGETHIGEMIVNKSIADDMIDIFKELYEAKYPIEKMVLVDEYDADDNASMAANNSSSFNYRLVPGSNHLSNHALGLAIDINPLYNPYVQYNDDETVILPEEGIPYADRSLDCPYYIDEEDLCYKAFTKRGFTWGGIWTRDPDYQHFEKEYGSK